MLIREEPALHTGAAQRTFLPRVSAAAYMAAADQLPIAFAHVGAEPRPVEPPVAQVESYDPVERRSSAKFGVITFILAILVS